MIKVFVETENGYSWHKLNKKQENHRVNTITLDNNVKIDISHVLSIKGKQDNYVVCLGCGEIIKNDPFEIEKHYASMEKKKNCMKCNDCSQKSSYRALKSTIKKIDGKYYKQEWYELSFLCSNSWRRLDINDKDINSTCKYYACRRLGTTPLSTVKQFDMFTKYPKFYSKILTEKALLKNGWEFQTLDGDKRIYNKKGALKNLKATCNKFGIVQGFAYEKRNTFYVLKYSPYYKMIYNPSDYLSSNILEKITKELNKLGG